MAICRAVPGRSHHVVWATGFLRPPVVQEAEGARMRIVTDFDPEDILEDTHDR